MKPILFNTEMVRAILEGRKTVTRRVVKPQSKNACGFYVTTRKSDGAFMGVYDYDENERMFENSQTPPAYVGQVLYVRETVWQKIGHYLDVDGETKGSYYNEFLYVATDKEPETGWNYSWVKRPSIHMPKEAARIFLRVTDVRVERLQDICNRGTPQDHVTNITREGLQFQSVMENYQKLIDDFKELWNSTIKKAQLNTYGWYANPYVWVIEFERITQEQAEGKAAAVL